jgi:hypothetical protein
VPEGSILSEAMIKDIAAGALAIEWVNKPTPGPKRQRWDRRTLQAEARKARWDDQWWMRELLQGSGRLK